MFLVITGLFFILNPLNAAAQATSAESHAEFKMQGFTDDEIREAEEKAYAAANATRDKSIISSESHVDWAKQEAMRKKKQDCSKVRFFRYDEGLCVQCLHIGSYDDEPATVKMMDEFVKENGCIVDIGEQRYHHEIYLSDPNKTEPAKLKTVIRHPIRKA